MPGWRRCAWMARLACVASVALLAAPAASAAAQRFAIDPANSRVDFRVRYLGLFTLGGRFAHPTGVVVFDPGHWESLEVTIEIPVDSLESRPQFWRSELLGPRFFDARRFPTIDWRAARAKRLESDNVETGGPLTLHGTTKPVTLRARIRTVDGQLEVDGEARLSRSAFGLGATLPLASDEVAVMLHVRATPAGAL